MAIPDMNVIWKMEKETFERLMVYSLCTKQKVDVHIRRRRKTKHTVTNMAKLCNTNEGPCVSSFLSINSSLRKPYRTHSRAQREGFVDCRTAEWCVVQQHVPPIQILLHFLQRQVIFTSVVWSAHMVTSEQGTLVVWFAARATSVRIITLSYIRTWSSSTSRGACNNHWTIDT